MEQLQMKILSPTSPAGARWSDPRPTDNHDTAHSVEPADTDLRAATERVSAYLRAVGLIDEESLNRVTRAVVARAAASTDAEPDLPRRAVLAAMNITEQWLRALSATAPRAAGAAHTTGHLPILLRAALRAHPEAFLNQAALPEPFRTSLERAAVPNLPEMSFRRMPHRRIGSVFVLLRRAYWYRLKRRLRAWWCRRIQRSAEGEVNS